MSENTVGCFPFHYRHLGRPLVERLARSPRRTSGTPYLWRAITGGLLRADRPIIAARGTGRRSPHVPVVGRQLSRARTLNVVASPRGEFGDLLASAGHQGVPVRATGRDWRPPPNAR